MKSKTVYVCEKCDYQSPKWYGKCPSCGAWDSMKEETYAPPAPEKASAPARTHTVSGGGARRISDPDADDAPERVSTGSEEFDRVLGGGLVDGSVVLVTGEPGIGKSTLLMQTCSAMASAGTTVLYVSGEESRGQLRMRAKRIGISASDVWLLTETDLDAIMAEYDRIKPDVTIVDSVQTVYRAALQSSAGSVAQVKECAAAFIGRAKTDGSTVVLVGHVNKEGAVAGPKVLEHMVDAVLSFEGERFGARRIVRAVKNRFGGTNEIGVFDMTDRGLADVPNPSEALLAERPRGLSGSCAAVVLEGTRPVIAEVQALVSKTAFPSPRRTANGADYNRLCLILAVLEKRLGLKFWENDVYVNVIGGLELDEPGADMAIALALISSLRDAAVPDDLIAMGELGLSGECRSVSGIEARAREAARLGFRRIVIPQHNAAVTGDAVGDSEIIPVRGIYDALKLLS
jgi:DNA repair protein RadA/Sms